MVDYGGSHVGFWIFVGLAAYACYESVQFKTAWYSFRYDVPMANVRISSRPTDCDFMRAPLGQKECDYELAIDTYNSEGDLIGNDAAFQFSHDAVTGKLIVSRDDGKTWSRYYGPEISDTRVTSVVLSWMKHSY